MTLPFTFNNFIGLRRYSILLVLIPGALNAMENALQIVQPTHQATHRVNRFPSLDVSMKLFKPNADLSSCNAPLTQRCCTAEPDEQGTYTMKQTAFAEYGVDYVPFLTNIEIDPANAIAPLIIYRIMHTSTLSPLAKIKNPPPEASDLKTSVTYAIPRTLDVEIENKDGSQTKLNLEIFIERITSLKLEQEWITDLENEMIAKQEQKKERKEYL